MRLEAAIGQLLMVGFDGLRAPEYIRDWLARERIGGVYLFARNVESPRQLRQLTDSLHQAAPEPILVGIDQEGGAIARLRHGFSQSPGALALAASGDIKLAERVGFMQGRELAALGINWNFAPVADVAQNQLNPSVGTRSFGADATTVAEFVAAQIRGFQRAGVAATVKHFPGLGKSIIDTHLAPARVKASLDALRAQDLVPFQRALESRVACVMTTHVIYEALDDQLPATLSPRLIDDLLRGELGYGGAVCSDCMEMKAITEPFGAGESAVLSLLAGVDMVMFSHSRSLQEEAYTALLAAAKSGRLSQKRISQSLSRISDMKRRFALRERPPLDIVNCAEHQRLSFEAARDGIALWRHGDALPITRNTGRTCCIEFASNESDLSQVLLRRLPMADCIKLPLDPAADTPLSSLDQRIQRADALIVATRSAHLLPAQAMIAERLIASHRRVVHVCLRHPADAALFAGSHAILASHGDSEPSLEAVVAALFGDFQATGEAAFTLETEA